MPVAVDVVQVGVVSGAGVLVGVGVAVAANSCATIPLCKLSGPSSPHPTKCRQAMASKIAAIFIILSFR
jgi:hypothetical protein